MNHNCATWWVFTNEHTLATSNLIGKQILAPQKSPYSLLDPLLSHRGNHGPPFLSWVSFARFKTLTSFEPYKIAYWLLLLKLGL